MQIVIGDFNCVLAPLDKTYGPSTDRKKTVIDETKKLRTNFDLQDVWSYNTPQNITIHTA